jgi:uroporphyrinogen-III decarboxylase
MTQKEIYLSALRCGNTGKTPLFLRFWHMSEKGEDFIPFRWRDQYRRVEWTTARGVTDTLLLQPPMGYIEDYDASKAPGISVDVERIERPGARYPLLRKVYHTPGGDLRQEVNVTEDWIYGDDVYLFSDFNVSRAAKHAVADMEDARKLRFLLGEPSNEAKAEFAAEAERIRSEALRLGVAVDGGWVALGDALVDLCGMERVLYAQYEEPEFLEAMLDTLLAWELKRVEAVLDAGADAIVYMAWYEGCDFWTPANWRKCLKPRIRQIIQLAHSRGAPFRYIMTKGSRPILEDLAEMGVDCLTGVDPLGDGADPAETRKAAGPGMALMGGLNSAIMLTQWKPQEIMQATQKALEALRGDPGFILFPVDAVFDGQPWENAETLIKAWEDFE